MRGSIVKNVMLGLISIFIIWYTVLIGLNILYFHTQKNELEKQVSRIVKNTLEMEYQKGEEAMVEQMILQEILNSVSTKKGKLAVDIQGIDLKKGLLSVKVTKRVELLNGREKEIVVEKTAIMDRVYLSNT